MAMVGVLLNKINYRAPQSADQDPTARMQADLALHSP